MEVRLPTRRSLLVSAVLVLMLGSTAPRLSGYIVDVRQSLVPLLHLYRGMTAAQAGDVHAAGAWLRKALRLNASTMAGEAARPLKPRDPFLLESSDCDPRTARPPAPEPETDDACPHT